MQRYSKPFRSSAAALELQAAIEADNQRKKYELQRKMAEEEAKNKFEKEEIKEVIKEEVKDEIQEKVQEVKEEVVQSVEPTKRASRQTNRRTQRNNDALKDPLKDSLKEAISESAKSSVLSEKNKKPSEIEICLAKGLLVTKGEDIPRKDTEIIIKALEILKKMGIMPY